MKKVKRKLKKFKIKISRFNKIEIGAWVDYLIGALIIIYAIIFFIEFYKKFSTPQPHLYDYGFLYIKNFLIS